MKYFYVNFKRNMVEEWKV